MAQLKSLTTIQRVAPDALLANFKSENERDSADAGARLVSQARNYGLNMRDYLRLAIQPTDEQRELKLNGYEAALDFLGLPVRDDFDEGVTLDLASDSFQMFPGTRAMFPEVVDDMVRWNYRQDLLETASALVSTSRTINGAEEISTVVPDKAEDYQGSRAVSEFGRIPVYSIQTSQTVVGMSKHGQGYRLSYEFSRRARLDLLTPYANRTRRELERSKVQAATAILINGDGVSAAAPVKNQSVFSGAAGRAATAGEIEYTRFLAWLVSRAKAGVPVDTAAGNWDAYLQWLFLFAVPELGGGGGSKDAAQNMAAAGVGLTGRLPILSSPVSFALASDVPAGQLVGFTKGETLEELVEAGSLINESERSITNQSITYVQTETTGYKMPFGDTREIYDFAH